MSEHNDETNAPDPMRLEALRNLPKGVLEDLSGEEVRAFLHEKDWPESLREKLKNYLVDEDGA